MAADFGQRHLLTQHHTRAGERWLIVPADATTIQNCDLLFGEICIQRLKVVLSLRLVEIPS
jgi:hypothetical protein